MRQNSKTKSNVGKLESEQAVSSLRALPGVSTLVTCGWFVHRLDLRSSLTTRCSKSHFAQSLQSPSVSDRTVSLAGCYLGLFIAWRQTGRSRGPNTEYLYGAVDQPLLLQTCVLRVRVPSQQTANAVSKGRVPSEWIEVVRLKRTGDKRTWHSLKWEKESSSLCAI